MTRPSKERMSKIGKSNVRKGKNHERRIARLLSEWTGEEFRRRRVEGRESNVIDRESTADIIPASKSIIFSIEAKSGTCPSLDGILSNPSKNKWTSWWHQCCYDAELLSKALNHQIWPMMFFKPHQNFDWVAIAKDPYEQVLKSNGEKVRIPNFFLDLFEWVGPISHNISNSPKNPVYKSLHLHSCYMVRWVDFAKSVDPISIFY
jgi:hypothetical protein